MQTDQRASLRAQSVNAHKAGKLDDALAGYTRYLTRFPDDAGVWTNLGALYRATARHDMARIAQARAYALDPNDSGILNNFANILSDIGEYERSIELRQASLKIDPTYLMHHAMIGRCYRGMGRYEEAIDYLTPKVLEHPEEPEIELQLAFAQLGARRYGAAFRTYEARWRTGEIELPDVTFPRWSEGVSIDGKTVLVLPEQGFGDMVLMARFIPLISKMGARVRLVAKKPLLRLLEGVEGIEWIEDAAKRGDPVDLWVSLMDLPKLIFGPEDAGNVPPPATLKIPADSSDRARVLTAQHRDMFKVGVVWSGSATYKGNNFRSFSHSEFLPLAEVPGVQMFSLYKGPLLEAYQKDGTSALILDTASTDRDFADCAATMKEMDLIITSDTATAHIAGSLGVPVWVLLHWDSFWVYRHDGDATPWYPSMRLFRQPQPQDWASVFDAAKGALVEKVEKNG